MGTESWSCIWRPQNITNRGISRGGYRISERGALVNCSMIKRGAFPSMRATFFSPLYEVWGSQKRWDPDPQEPPPPRTAPCFSALTSPRTPPPSPFQNSESAPDYLYESFRKVQDGNFWPLGVLPPWISTVVPHPSTHFPVAWIPPGAGADPKTSKRGENVVCVTVCTNAAHFST